MGDVAMVASVLKEFQQQHEDTEIIIVSRKLFSAFFERIPRVRFHILDPNYKHRGLTGLYLLFKELKEYKPDYIADLHNNLRSRVVGFLFKLAGFKVQVLDKGRQEKAALTRPKNKIKSPLTPTTERYAEVFRQLGFPLILSHKLQKDYRLIPTKLLGPLSSNQKKIGIAPFAQHRYKVLSLEKMEKIIAYLASRDIYEVFIFGGGEKEKAVAEGWSSKYPHVYNTIGSFNLSQELDIISHLDLMISMDSSGMHMASLVGTRCLSIWGATHPYAGFLGYGQQYEDCIQVEHPNRPSSVYGNKPCDCDGVEAIDLISAEAVIEKIKKVCE